MQEMKKMGYYDYFKKKGAKQPFECQTLAFWMESDRPTEEAEEYIRRQYTSKIQKGKFDRKLGIKGMVNHVVRAIAGFNKDPSNEFRLSLSQHDKELVATLFFDYMWDEYLKKIKAVIPPKSTRRFNNETYKFLKRCKTQPEAERNKAQILKNRAPGVKSSRKCRIFFSKDGYDLYVRGR